MLDLTVFDKVKYVVDSNGNKAAVQVDINLWGELLSYLEDLEDRSLIKDKLTRLRQGPEKSGGISWQDVNEEWSRREENRRQLIRFGWKPRCMNRGPGCQEKLGSGSSV